LESRRVLSVVLKVIIEEDLRIDSGSNMSMYLCMHLKELEVMFLVFCLFVIRTLLVCQHELALFYRSQGLRNRKDGNINRLTADDEDDESATWNGNSTQQM